MMRQNYHSCRLIISSVPFIIFLSCNDSQNIPFPKKELGYSQPVTVPLQLNPVKKLRWDIIKTGGIKPEAKNLDMDALPFVPYGTTGFTTFT